MMRRNRTVDMSPEAIDQRLRDVLQLYELGMALRDAQRLGRITQAGAESIAEEPLQRVLPPTRNCPEHSAEARPGSSEK